MVQSAGQATGYCPVWKPDGHANRAGICVIALRTSHVKAYYIKLVAASPILSAIKMYYKESSFQQ